jgi:hypothetical protein
VLHRLRLLPQCGLIHCPQLLLLQQRLQESLLLLLLLPHRQLQHRGLGTGSRCLETAPAVLQALGTGSQLRSGLPEQVSAALQLPVLLQLLQAAMPHLLPPLVRPAVHVAMQRQQQCDGASDLESPGRQFVQI